MLSQNSQTTAPVHPGDLDDPARPVVAVAVDHPGPHFFPPHSHFRAQLVYASAGVMTVVTATGTWVVPPQQAVWVPAGIEHEVRSAGPLAMRSLYVHPAATGGLPGTCCVVGVPPLLRELILRAVTFDATVAPSGPEARVLALIPDELKALEPEPLHLPLPRDRRLTAVTGRLAADPADGRPLAAWAQAAGASERTLARLFLKETGLTFGAWRQRLRLLAAIARLAEGQAVTGVAYDLGYDSPSAFIAMFRRTLGVPPGRYLKRAVK
jgi:AraC-like DNA-binding protein